VHRFQRDAGLTVGAIDRNIEHAARAWLTSFPLAATAPPDRPVRPPDGTIATRSTLAQCTTAWTCAIESGNAIASGAGVQRRVQSRP
jgi:hypothetical protein